MRVLVFVVSLGNSFDLYWRCFKRWDICRSRGKRVKGKVKFRVEEWNLSGCRCESERVGCRSWIWSRNGGWRRGLVFRIL